MATLSHKRGAEGNPIGVAGVVVIVRTVCVDISEIVAVVAVSRTKPPINGSRTNGLQKITCDLKY